jgi:hypothetical protein
LSCFCGEVVFVGPITSMDASGGGLGFWIPKRVRAVSGLKEESRWKCWDLLTILQSVSSQNCDEVVQEFGGRESMRQVEI